VSNFNYINFVTTQKHELDNKFIVNLILEHLVKDYLDNKNIILEGQLDEGIKDFVTKVKSKIKDSKKLKDLANFVKVLKDTRKPKAVMEFITLLKKTGVDLSNRKEVLASLHILGGEGNKLNEEKVPKETINSIQQKFESNPSIFGKLQKIVNQKAFKPIFGLVFTAVLSFSSLQFEVSQAIEPSGDEITNTQDMKSQVAGDENAYRIANNALEKFTDGDQTDQDGGEDIDQGELATDTAEIEDAKSQGLDLNLTGDETVNFTKYDNGSSQLNAEGKQKIASENSTIIDYLQNGQDYSETVVGVSSNTGGNADLDNQGGSVSQNRADNTANEILDNLESQLNEEGTQYERTGNTIKVEGGGTYTLEVGTTNNPDTLNSIDKTNDTATQSGVRVGTVGDTPPDAKTLFDLDPIDKITPDAIPINSDNFKEFNRNTQIAIIFSLFNPENNIFQLLGGQEGEAWNITGDLNDGLIGQYRNNSDEKISNLANAIANARKNRKSFVGAVGGSLGVELPILSPGKYRFTSDVETQTQGGKVSAGPRGNVQEIHPFNALLEAAYTSYIPSISDVNKKAEILVYLSTMYITLSKGNETIGISPNNLDDSLKTALSKYEGFHVITTGEEKGAWTFLTKGLESQLSNKISDEPAPAGGDTPSGDGIKLTPDVTRVKATMDRQPTLKNLFNRINTKVELKELIVYIVKYISPKFQEQKSQIKGALIRLSQADALNDKPLIRQALKEAAQEIGSDKKTTKSSTSSTTSTTAGSDIEIDYSIPGSSIRENILKNLIKQSIKEVIKEQQLEIPFPDNTQKDTQNVLNIFQDNSTLQSQIDKINTIKEFEEFISGVLIPNTALYNQK